MYSTAIIGKWLGNYGCGTMGGLVAEDVVVYESVGHYICDSRWDG